MLRHVTVVAFALAAAACHPFVAGSIARTSSGALEPNAAELHCLEVAVHPVGPELAETSVSLHVVYQFGNRCHATAVVDLAAPVVTALLADGRHETLSPAPVSGPRLSGVIDAYASGGENVGYRASTVDDTEQAVVAACFDVSRLEAGAKAAARPVCFRRGRDGVFASVEATDVDDAASPERKVGAVASVDASDSVKDEDGTRCSTSEGGARWCDTFGSWERAPAFVMAAGLSTHHYDLSQRTVSRGDYGPPGSVSAAPLGALQGETFDMSARHVFFWPFYFGFELQIGGTSVAHAAVLSPSPYLGVSGGWAMIGGGLTAGVETPRLGPIAAEAEMYAGGMTTSLTPDAATQPVNGCADLGDGCASPSLASWIFEPRLRVRAWVTPWLSVDAFGGVGVAPFGDWSAGLALAVHARSFDGSP